MTNGNNAQPVKFTPGNWIAMIAIIAVNTGSVMAWLYSIDRNVAELSVKVDESIRLQIEGLNDRVARLERIEDRQNSRSGER